MDAKSEFLVSVAARALLLLAALCLALIACAEERPPDPGVCEGAAQIERDTAIRCVQCGCPGPEAGTFVAELALDCHQRLVDAGRLAMCGAALRLADCDTVCAWPYWLHHAPPVGCGGVLETGIALRRVRQ